LGLQLAGTLQGGVQLVGVEIRFRKLQPGSHVLTKQVGHIGAVGLGVILARFVPGDARAQAKTKSNFDGDEQQQEVPEEEQQGMIENSRM
jgi:hypothetical protein